MSRGDGPAGPQPHLPPELQAEFAIESVLGRGGMGIVFAARERATGRAVAIKLVLGELSELRRGRFEREGQITASLQHPNVVGVHRAGMAGRIPYLVYELVEGARELQDALPVLDLHDRVDLVRQSAAAVGYAHTRGVLHRDLKPANILVNAQGQVRVADFGLARATHDDRLTRSGVMIGTPAYMAPELARGESNEAGPPCDVWSLGVVLYEAIADEHPFPAQTLFQLLDLLQKPVKPLAQSAPHLPRELNRICAKALQLAPEDRYPDAGALADDLQRFLDDPLGASRRGPRLGLAILGGGVALALGLGLAFAFANSPQPVRPPRTPLETPPAASPSPSATGPALPAGLTPIPESPALYRAREGSRLRRFSFADRRAPAPFFVSLRQVTRGQFARFCREAKHEPPEGLALERVTRPKAPVAGVSWEQAQSYCAYVGLRLPTEKEWELALGARQAPRLGLELRDWVARSHEGKPRLVLRGDPREPTDPSPRLVVSKDDGREDTGFRVACGERVEGPESQVRWERAGSGPFPERAFFEAAPVSGSAPGVLWFGGFRGEKQALGDTWLRSATGEVKQLPSRGAGPSPRADASLTWDAARGVAVLQGGNTATKPKRLLSDTWIWRDGTWEEVLLKREESCGARAWHSAAYDAAREEIVLFGGKRGVSKLDRGWSDTWIWDGKRWARRGSLQGPSARSSHAMAYDPNRERVVVFGGSLGGRPLADTWEWDGQTWTKPLLTRSPSKRYEPAMAYFPALRGLVLYGGHDGKSCLDDLWLYRERDWRQLEVSDFRPSPRKACAYALDPTSGRLLLIGGQNSSLQTRYTDELWELVPR